MLPHPRTEDEVAHIEPGILAERPRGERPSYWENVLPGQELDVVTKVRSG